MKKLLQHYILFAALMFGCIVSSCSKEDEPAIVETQTTIFMYLPWSSNLTNYFYQNIRDMESNICQMGGLGNDRIIVFMSTSAQEASMYEIKYKNGECVHVPISTYDNYPFTTEQGLTSLLQDMRSYAPAKKFAMIIGCHGMGWLPVKTSRSLSSTEKYHYEYEEGNRLTRYFGGTTADYQTNISTLSAALSNSGLKMEYILFDDCYMASIEVAYELRHVTDYLIASTCEVMAYGMPYATMGKYLLGKPDYKSVCDEFYNFYSNYEAMSYGTLSVTDCSELERMAELMLQINQTYKFDETKINSIQRLDGYSPAIFFDYGDYVNTILNDNNADQELKDEFNRQLTLTVPYQTHTESYYTAGRGVMPIYTYSGITISDPSVSSKATEKVSTKWYIATH